MPSEKLDPSVSVVVGRVIGHLAAKYLKRVLMELGGKCPAIVLKDVDLRRAATLCAQGATMHHGQVCMSTERIIVVEEVADEFTKFLREAVAEFHGNAGFAVSKQMAQKAQRLMSDATDNGATLLIGNNEKQGDSGAALEPTFITDVKTGNPICDLESLVHQPLYTLSEMKRKPYRQPTAARMVSLVLFTPKIL